MSRTSVLLSQLSSSDTDLRVCAHANIIPRSFVLTLVLEDLQSLMILPRDVSPRSDVQSGANSTIEEARNKVTQRVRMGSNEEEGSQAVKIKGGERQCSPRVKLEHIKRERSPGTPAVNADDDEVAFVSASKRRRVAMTITINEEGVETIDLT